MKRGQKFITIIVLIVLLALWLLERERVVSAWSTVQAARKPVPAQVGKPAATKPGSKPSTSPQVGK